MTCRTVGCMFCPKMMSYKPCYYEGSALFLSNAQKQPISIPAASPGGVRQMKHFVVAWSLPRAYAALEVIGLRDKSLSSCGCNQTTTTGNQAARAFWGVWQQLEK